jgi:hypothetical protein
MRNLSQGEHSTLLNPTLIGVIVVQTAERRDVLLFETESFFCSGKSGGLIFFVNSAKLFARLPSILPRRSREGRHSRGGTVRPVNPFPND